MLQVFLWHFLYSFYKSVAMRYLFFFLTVIFISVIQSCNRSPCYDYGYVCTRDRYLPSVNSLSSKNSDWLSHYKLGQPFTLNNDKGYTTAYSVTHKNLSYSDVTIGNKPIEIECCSSSGVEQTKIRVVSEVVSINGDGAWGPITLSRSKPINSSMNLEDSITYDNIPEKLTLGVLNSTASFNPDDTTTAGDVTYRDTITLAGNLYNNIHVIYARYSYGQIKAYEFYYSRQKGFIGVKLTNDEVWILK